MVYILKCVQCCIWLFERVIKFLNKSAYIQIALLGKPFCTSARKAFFLILRNALRFSTIAALSGIIHTIGFVFIMSGTVLIGYFLMREMHEELSPFVPIVCFTLVSYVVAKLYMNVFGLAVDTALQCFLACEEMGIGGECVPSCLRRFVDTGGKEEAEDEGKSSDEALEQPAESVEQPAESVEANSEEFVTPEA